MAGQPEKRSTLGHLLNVSMPFSKDQPVWKLICQGVSELEEEFNPDTDDQQYICDDVKTTILKTYAPSFEISMGYQKDDLLQYYFDVMSKRLPTGDKTNIEYIRFNKNETMFGTSNQFIGVKWNANIRFDSIGGAGDDYLTSGMTVAATGSPEVGYVVVTDTGNGASYEWHKADIEVPFVTKINNVSMSGYYSGLPVENSPLVVEGKGIVGDKIELKSEGSLAGSVVDVDASGNWSMNISISGPSGNKNFAFIQKDSSEQDANQSVTTRLYSINVQAPSSPVVSKINDINVNEYDPSTDQISTSSFTVTGTGTNGYTISLLADSGLTADDVTVSSGTWSMTINLASSTVGNKKFKFIQTNPSTSIPSSPSTEYTANCNYT